MSRSEGRSAPVRRRGVIALLIAVAAILLIAAGCGGDDSGGSASSSGTGDGASSAQLDKAKAIVEKAETRPTQISQTDPITKPIPSGKKIAYISCGVTACAQQGKILSEGAAMLGWTVTTINTDGSPEKVNNAFESAIRDGANAVILQAASKAAIAKPLADAKKAGIEFATCCSTDPAGTHVVNTGTVEQGGRIGQYHAAKMIVDSGGKANVLIVDLPAFQILGAVADKFASTLDEMCPGCKHDKIDIPLTALGKDVPDRIVAYLRSHPNVDYVFLIEGALAPGVKAAIQAAGLTDKVKISAQGGDQATNLELSQGNPWLALTPAQLYSYDYNELDGLARKWSGVPVEESEVPDLWLMTQQTVPKPSPPVIPIVEDYKTQWAKIWGKPSS
jgi:ABC-type sugar transport system substrate-binding protein